MAVKTAFYRYTRLFFYYIFNRGWWVICFKPILKIIPEKLTIYEDFKD